MTTTTTTTTVTTTTTTTTSTPARPKTWKYGPGVRFGSLVITERGGKYKGQSRAVVQCDCGSERKVVGMGNLAAGLLTSCADREAHQDGRFIGDDVSYGGAHSRTKNSRGSASAHKCQKCPEQAEQWAFGHGTYDVKADDSGKEKGRPFSPDPSAYFPLCRSCHTRWDRAHRKLTVPGMPSLVHIAFWAMQEQVEL